MDDIDILGTNDNINALCDWIDEWRCFKRMFPDYVNDPVDLDKERCFV